MFIAAALIIPLVLSCEEEEKEKFDYPMKFNFSYLNKAEVVNYSDQHVDIELHITNLQTYYDEDYIEEYVNLDTSQLLFPIAEDYYYEVINAEYVPPEEPVPYSMCILLDQSGGYINIDKNNHRYEALNGFMQTFDPKSEFVFAVYSQGGNLKN